MTQKRAAIYCRVSTEMQATSDRSSLQTQERLCRERAAADGYGVVEQYVIHDASSGSDDVAHREHLERLLRAAERGEFDVVIMDLIDRTSRGGIFEFADICNRFLRFDVTPLWATDRDIDLTTPTGQLLAAVKSWAAYQEKEAIARRMQRGKQGRIARGELAREYCPYGYKWNADRTQYEPDPATAPILQRIYHDVAAGQSVSAVARALNAAGVPTPSQVKGTRRTHQRFTRNAQCWTEPTMAYLIRNPVYKDERVQNRFESTPRSRQDRLERNLVSERAHTERAAAHWVVTSVPALIDVATWDAALAQSRRGNFGKTKSPIRFTDADVLLYGGFVRCALCGRGLNPRKRQPTAKKPTARGWYYTCARHAHLPGNGERCIGTAINCDLVDAVVWAEALRLIRDPQHLRMLLTQSESVWSPETQIAHYTELLAKLDKEDADITSELLRLAGKPGLAQIRANLELQAAQHAELREGYQQRLAEAEAERQRLAARAERVTAFAVWATEQAETVTDLTATERREILVRTLHPTVFVGRVGSDLPRIAIFFSVTPEAAAQIDSGTLYATMQWHGATGGVYTVFVDEWSGERNAGAGDELDLSNVEAQDLEMFQQDGFSILRPSARRRA